MGFIKEFKEFAIKGNMIDMAVGIIIGAAFGAVVKSIVDKLFMPPLGLLMGQADFKDYKWTIKDGVLKEGVTVAPKDANSPNWAVQPVAIEYGAFVTEMINFLLVAFAVFLLIKGINKLKRKEEAKPAAPPRQEVLLEEIRDAIKAKA
ncbi:MAG: large-conductance mechanosensitive channel protein MscL [Phycisphaerae bacterium]